MTRWAILLAGAAVLAGGLWWLIDSRARMSAEIDDLRARIETGRRMDNADTNMRGRDDAGILDWLHRRGQ